MTATHSRPSRFPWPPILYLAAIAVAAVLNLLYPLPWIGQPLSGLLFAIGTGTVPLLLGDQFMESAIFETDLPLFGHVKFTSVLVFDTGVYLVVLGMAMLLLEQFGRADGSSDEDGTPDRDLDAGGAA